MENGKGKKTVSSRGAVMQGGIMRSMRILNFDLPDDRSLAVTGRK
jgi:hypothetical protein